LTKRRGLLCGTRTNVSNDHRQNVRVDAGPPLWYSDRLFNEGASLTRSATWTARWTLAIVACAACVAAAAAEPIAASRGRWAGPIGDASGWPAGAGRIELRVDGSDARFKVDLTGASGALVAGEFAAGKQKDVFGPPATSGLMSWLGRGSAVNPLEGKPLAWARREGDVLVVYRLDLRGGAHRLDRLELKPSGERIGVVFERREHDRPPERFAATLERSAR
jgi:hypothetical protein